MNRLRVTLTVSMLTLLLFPLLAHAQTKDNSIEASWERASSTPPRETRVQPAPPAPVERSEGLKYEDTAWDASRSEKSRPWPKLTSSSTAKEYFDANAAVIDSLSHLYCLSSNYISTLRIRNQQAMQDRDPQLDEFDYEEGQQPVPSADARMSVQALHKELMQLLERCLVGR
ncbi:hypothetical protein KQI65_06665 [bacterium]|nr:hypothetical protein [bacterium]